MMADIRDTTGETGTREGDTVPKNQRDSTTGTGRFSGGQGIHSNGIYRKNGGDGGARGGNGNNTNPPTKTRRKCEVAVRTVGKEVGQRRKNDWLGGWGKYIFVRPFHRGAHSEAMPLSAHSKAMPSSHLL